MNYRRETKKRSLARKQRSRFRRSAIESLESRTLMAANVAQPFHNLVRVTDVNNDGRTTNVDFFIVAQELRRSGSKVLYTPPTGAVATGEGESPSLMFDVNGDNKLTNLDALLVARALRGEGQNDIAQFDLSFLDPTTNNPITTPLNPNDPYRLKVTIQDIRTGLPVAQMGMDTAFLSMNFPAAYTQSTSPLNFTPPNAADTNYSNFPQGTIVNAAGTITDAGGTIASVGLAGNGKIFVLTDDYAVGADAPPLDAAAAVNDNLMAGQNSNAVLFDVLMNDSLTGSITFNSLPATGVGTEIYSASPFAIVPTSQVIYGSASLKVNAAAIITGLGPTSNGGTVNIKNAGTRVEYTPAPGFAGTETFTYTISGTGLNGGSSTATVSVVVAAVNLTPNLTADTYKLLQNSTNNTLDVLANDNPGNGEAGTQTLTITGITQPVVGGAVVNNGGNLSFTPTPGFIGQASFSYTAQDNGLPAPLSATTTVTINVAAPVARVSLEVHDVNTNAVLPAVAIGDQFYVVAFVEDLRPGTPPPLNFHGIASAYMDIFYNQAFMHALTTANPNFANLNITFNSTGTPAWDDLPVAMGGVARVNAVDLPGGHIDDVGTGLKDLGQAATTGPGKFEIFRIRFMADAQVFNTLIDPTAPDILGDEITFSEPPIVLVPGSDVEFDPAVLTIANLSANAPVAVNDGAYTVNENTVLTVNAAGNITGTGGAFNPAFGVLNNDTDADQPGTTLHATVQNNPVHGTVTLNDDGTFTYTPVANYVGPDMFTYFANDGARSSVTPATVTINVAFVPQAPVAANDSYGVNQGGTLVVPSAGNPGLLANDTLNATSMDNGPFVVMVVTGPMHGTFQGGMVNSDGSFTYIPDPMYSGPDSFTYKVINTSPNNGLMSNTATVTLNVGIIPGSVSGRVYVDADGNGVFTQGANANTTERTIGGVAVRINGTDILGNAVSRTTTTDANGQYTFGNINPGNYTLTEFNPILFLGTSSQSKTTVLASGGNALVDFSTPGLQSAFISERDYLCSTDRNGVWLGFRGTVPLSEWFVLGQGWNGYKSVTASLSSNRLSIVITAVDAMNVTHSTTMATTNNEHVRFCGENGLGVVVRLDGLPSDFGF